MTTIYSVGYSGFDIESFISVLVERKIELLVDSRERPLSRKTGFSKTRLSQALANMGIEYFHDSKLGSPSAARTQLKIDGLYDRFFKTVNFHLTQNSVDPIQQIAKQALRKRTCIMCVCADVSLCHRSVIIQKLHEIIEFKPLEVVIRKIAA